MRCWMPGELEMSRLSTAPEVALIISRFGALRSTTSNVSAFQSPSERRINRSRGCNRDNYSYLHTIPQVLQQRGASPAPAVLETRVRLGRRRVLNLRNRPNPLHTVEPNW